MARGYRTGRADQCREFLAANPGKAFTVKEVAEGIGFTAQRDPLNATLATLAKSGEAERLPGVLGYTRFRWLGGDRKPERRLLASPPPPVPRPRSLGNSPRMCAPRKTASTARRMAAPANFAAPLATVDRSFDPRRADSERIAADIAEFERRGGRIERLGVTKLFHHPDDCED